MVQTEDQYVFIHNALIDYMEAGETEVEASDLREYIKKQSQVDSKTGQLICPTFITNILKINSTSIQLGHNILCFQ